MTAPGRNQADKRRARINKDKKSLLDSLTEGESLSSTLKSLGRSEGWLRHHKQSDPAFGAEVEAIMSSPLHQRRIAQSMSAFDPDDPQAKKDRFIGHYEASLDRMAACTAAGYEWHQVESMLDPDHADYDEDFRIRYQRVAQTATVRVYDNLVKQAARDGSPAMVRFMIDQQKQRGSAPEGGTVYNFYFNQKDEGWAKQFLADSFPVKKIESAADTG